MNKCCECGKAAPDPIYVDSIGYGEGPDLVFCGWACIVAWGTEVLTEDRENEEA